MRILIVTQGSYGQRMVENIRKYASGNWDIAQIVLPTGLLPVIDDADQFLPSSISRGDLLISLGEEQGVAQIIPDIAERSGARAVIAPADNRQWLPAGLARQVQQKLEKKGVKMVYPVPFCTLTLKDSDNEFIREFASYFGKPEVAIKLDGNNIAGVKVIKGAPCGSTIYVAEHLPGIWTREAIEQAGLMHHQYPCLSTMTMDKEFEDTLMHRAGLMTKLAVEDALKAAKTE